MAWLTYKEIRDKYGIARTTLIGWAQKDKIITRKEIRNGREVTVCDESSVEQCRTLDSTTSDKPYEFTDADNPDTSDMSDMSNRQIALNLAQSMSSIVSNQIQYITQLEHTIREKDEKLQEYAREVGRLSGELSSVEKVLSERDERLKEKDSIIAEKTAEIMEWKRELAVSKETKRNKWKWPWQK